MIRPATPDDAKAIADLWNWMINETLATFTTVEKTQEDINAMIAAREGAFVVSADQGTLKGFATFGPFRGGPGYAAAAEHSIVIDPKCQGAGLGRALMLAMEGCARTKAIHTLVGAISGANPQAIEFHKSLGYTEAGVLLQAGRKKDQWLDLVLMQKILNDDE